MVTVPWNEARVLVTGSSGFVGTHLCAALREVGAALWAVDRTRLARIELLTELMAGIAPTHIFHLAGLLHGAPGGYAAQHDANALTTSRLLEAVVASRQDPWIMVASSSAVYGQTAPEDNPLSEDRALRPLTDYGVSQVTREMLALKSHLAHGLRTVRVRTFNLVGPGQPESLLASELTRQIALAEREAAEAAIRVGNLFPRRDFTDVRDAVQAYLRLATIAQGGQVYNVCSGSSVSVQGCVDALAGIANVSLRVVRDPDRVRTIEIADQVGDPARLSRATGWQPTIPLKVSFQEMLAFWRSRLEVGSRT